MNAATTKEVAIVKAEESANVLITQVEGEKNTAQSHIQAKVVEIVNRSKAAANAMVTGQKQQAEVNQIEAESKLQATAAKYAGLAQEARSEQANLEAFDASRRHEFELKKAQVYNQLAANQKNIVVSGETGDQILNQLISMTLDGDAPKKRK